MMYFGLGSRNPELVYSTLSALDCKVFGDENALFTILLTLALNDLHEVLNKPGTGLVPKMRLCLNSKNAIPHEDYSSAFPKAKARIDMLIPGLVSSIFVRTAEDFARKITDIDDSNFSQYDMSTDIYEAKDIVKVVQDVFAGTKTLSQQNFAALLDSISSKEPGRTKHAFVSLFAKEPDIEIIGNAALEQNGTKDELLRELCHINLPPREPCNQIMLWYANNRPLDPEEFKRVFCKLVKWEVLPFSLYDIAKKGDSYRSAVWMALATKLDDEMILERYLKHEERTIKAIIMGNYKLLREMQPNGIQIIEKILSHCNTEVFKTVMEQELVDKSLPAPRPKLSCKHVIGSYKKIATHMASEEGSQQCDILRKDKSLANNWKAGLLEFIMTKYQKKEEIVEFREAVIGMEDNFGIVFTHAEAIHIHWHYCCLSKP